MEHILTGVVGGTLGLFLILLRVPIGVALGLVSFLGIAVLLNFKAAFGILSAVPFNFVGDWSLTAVPMFLLMGYVASSSGLARQLFGSVHILMRNLPGGLALTSVAACALMSAASGSSVATSSAFANIATPEMLKHRYDPGLATGVIAAAGTLGSLIPPSILMLLYAYTAGVSVSDMFAAGILPGLLSAFVFATMIVIRVYFNPSLAPKLEETSTRQERLAALGQVWPLPFVVIIVLAGIFLGIFSPTEAGAVGALLVIIIAYLGPGLERDKVLHAIKSTLLGTSNIFLVVIGTALFAKFMALSTVPTFASEALLSFADRPIFAIAIFCVVILILGCFIDSISILLLTLPIFLPVARDFGIDLIYFGIIMIKLLEIGLVTPPVGLNVYVIKSALGDQVSLGTIFRGVSWFIAVDVFTLILIISIPALSLFIPGLWN